MLSIWTGLKFCQGILRQQNKCDQKIEICSEKGRKHSGKRVKCWLPAFSSFPIIFSKGCLPRIVKSGDCVVKSYTGSSFGVYHFIVRKGEMLVTIFFSFSHDTGFYGKMVKQYNSFLKKKAMI